MNKIDSEPEARPDSVLLIEDDWDIRSSLAELLELEGYEVWQAAHGREGLEILQSGTHNPSFIVLDLMMPVMDGMEFMTAKGKAENLKKIPVLVLSADNSMKRNAKNIGATSYMKKPIDIDELLTAVRLISAPQ